MVLSTVSNENRPASRVVLLKKLDSDGLVFYTNYHSRKASHLDANPAASLVFFWPSLEKQVRVEGLIVKVPAGESDRYFSERPWISQIGAWASPQSEVIRDRKFLEERFHFYEKQFANRDVIRPSHWGGYRLLPEYFEFWQGAPGRLHDRLVFEKSTEDWILKRLAP